MNECWWCQWRRCITEWAGVVGEDGLCSLHHAKDLRLRRTYGIGLKEVGVILEVQYDRCPVCLVKFEGDDWVIDHDHRKGGKVRGCLHLFCNHRVVGRHTDGEKLIRAGSYLNDPPAARALGEDLPEVPKKSRKKRTPKK